MLSFIVWICFWEAAVQSRTAFPLPWHLSHGHMTSSGQWNVSGIDVRCVSLLIGGVCHVPSYALPSFSVGGDGDIIRASQGDAWFALDSASARK